MRLVEGFFLVGGDGAVGGGVGDAGEDEALAHLVVIKERLVRLVNATGINLTGARRASSSAARVREVNSCKKKEQFMSVQGEPENVPEMMMRIDKKIST
jgi:hypothetical protein